MPGMDADTPNELSHRRSAAMIGIIIFIGGGGRVVKERGREWLSVINQAESAFISCDNLYNGKMRDKSVRDLPQAVRNMSGDNRNGASQRDNLKNFPSDFSCRVLYLISLSFMTRTFDST